MAFVQINTPTYYSDQANRDNDEIAEFFEDIATAVRGAYGNGQETLVETISGGVLSPAGQNCMIEVEPETGTSDVLDTIQTTNHAHRQMIFLRLADPTDTITVTHAAGGAGSIQLKNSDDFMMDSIHDTLILQRWFTVWYEVSRWALPADLRSFLGLGTAATMDEGPTNGLDADTVDGSHASAFLGVAAQAADSAQLIGHAGAQFVRKNDTGTQTLSGRFRAIDSLDVEAGTGNDTSTIRIREDNSGVPRERSRLRWWESLEHLRIEVLDSGGTSVCELRFDPTEKSIEIRNDSGGGPKLFASRPSSPGNGNVWFESNDLRCWSGGAERNFSSI